VYLPGGPGARADGRAAAFGARLKHKALVVGDDPQSLDLIEDVLAVLDHKHDVAATLLEARRLARANEYSYILPGIEFPARAPRGISRIRNAENFLLDLAACDGNDVSPVIIMNDRAAGDLDVTEDMMRLAMSPGGKGAIDLIKKPFPTAGRTRGPGGVVADGHRSGQVTDGRPHVAEVAAGPRTGLDGRESRRVPDQRQDPTGSPN